MDWTYKKLSYPLGHWLSDGVTGRAGRRPKPDDSQTKFDDTEQTFDNMQTTWDGKRSPPPAPNYAGHLFFNVAGQSGAMMWMGMI